MRLDRIPVLAIAVLWLTSSVAGCVWVPLDPQAESVRVATSLEAVQDCKKLGVVRSRTRTRIGFIARSEEKISEELTALARNNAAEMEADTIVADGPPSVDGRQRFLAYRCR
ncbi:MAG TPA: DUF4156 domain-containing protein [Myxococcota bacterium]|nr:DUF4156 domain-containing protein [Myxococcota bacterium]